MSASKEWFVASTTDSTFVYSNSGDNLTQIQTLEGSQFYHKISPDGKEIIIGQQGELVMYAIDCNSNAGEFYNTSSSAC